MQLLELARENAELTGQLSQLLREAERIQRLLADRSLQIPSALPVPERSQGVGWPNS